MEKLKNLKLLTIFKRLFICFSVVNLLIIGSVFVKPEANYVYADSNIDDSNSKSIFINLAFMVMGALGIQTVRSVTGLGNAFADSLGDLYDNWLATTSLTTQAVTALLSAHLHVTKQNTLSLAGPLYNQIANFLTYLQKVPDIFTVDPYFTYNMPGNYVIPLTLTKLAETSDTYYYLQSGSSSVRIIALDLGYTIELAAVSIAAGQTLTTQLFYPSTGNFSNTATYDLIRSTVINGITYYYYSYVDLPTSSTFAFETSQFMSSIGNLAANYVYYAFGVGAVGGTDGTIGLPDPITRNRDTPFPGVADDDSVPLSVPGDFANDWPLDDDTDIPLAIPRAIPWVYDIPIDTPIDTPIDIPFFFDPNSPGVPIPPGIIDLPEEWYNIPLIVSPECQSLSACLLSGVETVSSNLQSFYNIHPDVAAFTSLSIGIGFALLVLGVIF